MQINNCSNTALEMNESFTFLEHSNHSNRKNVSLLVANNILQVFLEQNM